MRLISLVKLARPSHWVKNILVLAGVFFAQEATNPYALGDALQMFVAFCLGASAVYVFNDIRDAEQDRLHPVKKYRPIASGKVSKESALIWFVLLAAGTGLLAYGISEDAFLVLFFYLFLNIFYSFGLKHIPVIELISVPLSYVLRVVAGAVAVGVPVSAWIILCTFFGSLLIVSGKRLAEHAREVRRKVLELYRKEFLIVLVTFSATLTVIMYALYATLSISGVIPMISIGLVVLGVLRFTHVLFSTTLGEFPEKIFFADRTLQCTLLAWFILMFYVFYA